MELLGNILYDTVYHSAPIILCAVGGMFAYKANVLNIALEGMMLNGAFVSVLTAYLTNNIWLAVLAALVTTLLWGLVFSFLGITCKGNVIVIGLGINLIVPAIAKFILKMMEMANINLSEMNVASFKINIPLIQDIPLVGQILSGHPPTTYLAFVAIVFFAVLMYKTRFGIYVRVVGENEDSAISLGIKTNRYKYAAVLIGALCCALAGIDLSLERLAMFTNDMTAGRGFIAIAAIYCGQGRPGALGSVRHPLWRGPVSGGELKRLRGTCGGTLRYDPLHHHGDGAGGGILCKIPRREGERLQAGSIGGEYGKDSIDYCRYGAGFHGSRGISILPPEPGNPPPDPAGAG